MFGFGGYGYGGGGYGESGCETGGNYRSCGNGFALIVVLFILLIIVGAACL
ncbi:MULTISPECIES: YjcZ family sporulation protein [unclassified Sporosarcina]|uniref:YjcZ family sporulation protein n=1 Tax=unclassified Sporosarcina TaxID=2647733 RepID=UPI000C164335|nr:MULTISPECIES: YjcZ family sporulation protein [unclassified Sporosarcina]PID02569.1 sporulation protein YjcZ [Sporosarcina sp. P2]PID23314.1 sporulation protein YjcZ [Sporosarcina sp. P7]